MLTQFFLPLFFSFTAAALVTPAVIAVYTRLKWIDDPARGNHPKIVHTRPVPRGGGLVIFLGVVIAALAFLNFDKHVLGILLGALILTITGVVDDVRDLNPYLRLVLLLLAALCVVGSGIGIAYVSNPFAAGSVIDLSHPQLVFNLLGSSHTIWLLADAFALVWIMWNMNIVNWSKGLDGQMPGFVGIAALVIGLLSLRFSTDPAQLEVTQLALIVSGTFFGFLLWNFYPQKIMAGFGAGSLAGYFLAVLSILSGAKVATALLVLAIPTIDAAYVIARRLLQRKSPVWGDRGHLHHRLLDLGWGKRKIALFYWATTAILGGLSLQLNSSQKFYTILGLVILFGSLIAWITLFFSSSKQLAQDSG
jgi:UDP-GlcNAc:undecaprenyl-phosphate GlcNAc-1-phosphate transferase